MSPAAVFRVQFPTRMKLPCSKCQSVVSLPGEVEVPGYVCPSCRGETPDAVGKYRITGFLGAGGMGQVYKAIHPGLERTVAVKVLRDFDANPSFLERFRREAKLAARLAHPSIVAVYDYDTFRGAPYLVMEFVEGRSLKDLIREGPMNPVRCVEIARAVADALHYAHEQGVVHRDVKPTNVMIEPNGRPRLLDFGLSRSEADGSFSLTGDIIGTPAYMSPEQASGKRGAVDRRSDVYSLGATLYEMLTGRPPLAGGSVLELIARIPDEPPRPPSELRPGLSSALDAAILRALAKDPAARFQTAAEFAKALEGVPVRGAPAARRKPVWPWAAAAVVAAGVAAALHFPAGGRPARDVPVPALKAQRVDRIERYLDSFVDDQGVLFLAMPELFPPPPGGRSLEEELDSTGAPEHRILVVRTLHLLHEHAFGVSEDLLERATRLGADPDHLRFLTVILDLMNAASRQDRRLLDKIAQETVDDDSRTRAVRKLAAAALGRLGDEGGSHRAIALLALRRFDEAERAAPSPEFRLLLRIAGVLEAQSPPSDEWIRTLSADAATALGGDRTSAARVAGAFGFAIRSDWEGMISCLEGRAVSHAGLLFHTALDHLRALWLLCGSRKAKPDVMRCALDLQMRLRLHDRARKTCEEMLRTPGSPKNPNDLRQMAHLNLAVLADREGKEDLFLHHVGEALKAGLRPSDLRGHPQYDEWSRKRPRILRLLERTH